MWINTKTSNLTAGWQEALADKDLDRKSLRSNCEWFNLETGSSIALVSNGAWQTARNNESGPSSYQVFHKAATGQVVDLTYAMIGHTASGGRFLRDGSSGIDAFSGVRKECEQAISDQLQSTTNWDL